MSIQYKKYDRGSRGPRRERNLTMSLGPLFFHWEYISQGPLIDLRHFHLSIPMIPILISITELLKSKHENGKPAFFTRIIFYLNAWNPACKFNTPWFHHPYKTVIVYQTWEVYTNPYKISSVIIWLYGCYIIKKINHYRYNTK